MRKIAIAIFLTALLLVRSSFAQGLEDEDLQQPLYRGLPFDRLTLASYYNGVTFDIRPIEFGEMGRPNPLPRIGDLTIRFVNNPLKEYTIKWNHVGSIELFCELVFKEFQQKLDDLVDKTRSISPNDAAWHSLSFSYEDIYEYLLYLEDFKRELPELQTAYEKFLFEEAVYRVKSGDFSTGLIRFESAYRSNKDYPGLSRAWGAALELLFAEQSRRAEFDKIRKQLVRFKEFYPEHSIIKDWEERIHTAAQHRLDASLEAATVKDFITANFLLEEAVNIDPALNGLNAWRQQLKRDALRINVAVQSPSDAAYLADWGTSRQRRLLQRTLTEYVQPSVE